MKMTNLVRLAVAIPALLLPGLALADSSGTQTLSAGSGFSFDTATVTSSGDISFSSSGITFVGKAKGLNLGAIGSEYSSLTGSLLQEFASGATTTPIPASSLTVGDVFAVLTNGGNTAKAMVTASSSSSISFEYTTYGSSTTGGSGGTGGASAPTVTDIENNSSLVPAGFPNSGVAPSTLFVLHGSGLASATTVTTLQDSTKGLPTTLNGATVTISAGGKTFTPGLYYAIATQIAGVLPAAVPPGAATLTVNYNNATSASFSFTVVASAYGIDTYNGNLAVLQDALHPTNLINYTNSGQPNQIVILWGSGLGSDSADSDTTYTGTPHTINTATQIFVGGVQVPQSSIQYVGASVYPGVHIIQFVLPAGVPNGCFVPLAVVTGSSTVSNVPTIPYMNGGGVCTDAYTGLSGTTITNLTSQTNVKSGSVIIAQGTAPGTGGTPTTADIAIADFQQVVGTSTFSSSGFESLGTCALTQSFQSTGTSTVTETGINAGTITVTTPGGSTVTLQTIPIEAGLYEGELPAGSIPTSGGTFTINGSGGTGTPSAGPFTATVNFPNPIQWTNESASAAVTRTGGQTYTWSGGSANTYVLVTGSSTSGSASGSYSCIFPQSAGQGTVPEYILLGLPAGTGTSTLENSTPFGSFTATGIDYGITFGYIGFTTNTTWQ